jgi:hypothetical protein
MATLNSILRSLFDTLLGPFQGLSPVVVLIPVSLLTAIFALLVMKYTSKQERLAEVKDQMFAGIFEIRLFNDNMALIFKAVGTIFNYAVRYIVLSVWPAFVIIMIPVVFIIAQLQFHYGYNGLEPGDEILLRVELVAPEGQETFDTGAPKPSHNLDIPAGISQETAAVWAPSLNQLAWRLRVEERGEYEIGITVNGESATKTVNATEGWIRRAPARTDTGFLNQLLYPAEAPLPAEGGLTQIAIDYPEATFPFLFINWNWLVLYLVLMILLGFALAKPLGVTV